MWVSATGQDNSAVGTVCAHVAVNGVAGVRWGNSGTKGGGGFYGDVVAADDG